MVWIVTLVVKCSSNSAFGKIEWFETAETALDRHTGGEMRSSNSAFGEIEWF